MTAAKEAPRSMRNKRDDVGTFFKRLGRGGLVCHQGVGPSHRLGVNMKERSGEGPSSEGIT